METNILSLPADVHDNIATNLVARDTLSLSLSCRRFRRTLGPTNKFLWFAKLCLPRLSTSENGDHRFTPFNTSRNWYTECVRIMNSCDQRDRCAWCLATGEGLMRKSRVRYFIHDKRTAGKTGWPICISCYEEFYECYDSFKESHIKLPNLPQVARSVKQTSGATGLFQNINRIVIRKSEATSIIERHASSSKVICSESRNFSSRFNSSMKKYIEAADISIESLVVGYDGFYKRFHFILSVEKFRRFVGEVLVAGAIGSFARRNEDEKAGGFVTRLFEIFKHIYRNTDNFGGNLRRKALIKVKAQDYLDVLFGANDDQSIPLAQIFDRKYLRDWMEEWFKASAWGRHFKGHKYQHLKCSICAKDMPTANCCYNGNLGEEFPGR
ncbi:hypothetical protein TWF225_009877 [Orbilia oligospora]|uniref:Uncharacterized protein n=1 Tax=Orbilia oligospora TaxID=2813651 RepID=A0A7C8KAZ8_ORBOL|nr:hypothetical protein TWF751_008776 [Orbilia oligospora]KAF3173098.1 hypothetical protein TWF225_009877 [Orbilia oligospora]KAF3266358.1 hypothetical protein TWF128_010772 [Orbilia oligospora]KAF3269275.1 hypothetical protein TWF217_009366 [Orbilia oligospora]TGJ62995.1 hypothetical protein EYR41_010945 [Orbilia oligospora]